MRSYADLTFAAMRLWAEKWPAGIELGSAAEDRNSRAAELIYAMVDAERQSCLLGCRSPYRDPDDLCDEHSSYDASDIWDDSLTASQSMLMETDDRLTLMALNPVDRYEARIATLILQDRQTDSKGTKIC